MPLLPVTLRGAKAAQMDCQAFFLSLYFKNKVARYTALVYSVKSNGFLVYIPAIDHKGKKNRTIISKPISPF